jgi:hypothetical protein
MNGQSQWERQISRFFKKTGEELKRAGDELRREGEKLLDEVKDPKRQKKVKEGFHDLQSWARKTAEEAAELVERGVKKVEGALHLKGNGGVGSKAAPTSSATTSTPSNGGPAKTKAKSASPKARKTIQRRASSATKGATKPKAKTKKTVGRSRAPKSV